MWCLYYNHDESLDYTISPCQVLRKTKQEAKVKVLGREPMWINRALLFETSQEACEKMQSRQGKPR